MERRPDALLSHGVVHVDEVPLYGDGSATRRRRLHRILSAGAAAIALVLVSGGIFVLTQRNVATTVTVDDAVARFRSEENGSAPAASSRTRRAVVEGDAAEAAPELGLRPPIGADASADAEPDTRIVRAAAVLPPEGVYTYRTTGYETVSTFGARHDYPERNVATVRHLDGCRWEHRNEVLEEHVDIRHFCAEAGSMSQVFYAREVTFFGKKDGGAMTCDPPMVFLTDGMKRDGRTVARCADEKGGSAVMTRTFVGTEVLRIGGGAVDAVKLTIEARMSGSVDGESFDALWLHPKTGMTLKWDRTVDTLATAYGAKVRYKEEATFVLESLDPQR